MTTTIKLHPAVLYGRDALMRDSVIYDTMGCDAMMETDFALLNITDT